VQRGVYSDSACTRAWQKHPPSPSPDSASVTAVLRVFLYSLLDRCVPVVSEDRRPARSSSSLRTAALWGGLGVAAAFAFPFPFSDFAGCDKPGGRIRSDGRDPREVHAVPRLGRGGICGENLPVEWLSVCVWRRFLRMVVCISLSRQTQARGSKVPSL